MAYRACKLCHSYGTKIPDYAAGMTERIAMYSFLRDNANFEAMRALEREDDKRAYHVTDPFKYLPITALSACTNCDYKEPMIANLVEKKIKQP